MRSALTDLSARLTARRGNHPILWIVFGAVAGFGVVASLFAGATAIPVPRLWRALQGFSASRFDEVSFGDEPVIFLGWISISFLLAAACLAIGVTGLRHRSRSARQRRQRVSDL